MNTFQLKEIIEEDKIAKQQFQGVYPSDLLPKWIKAYPSAYVANVDPAEKIGNHWVAFYFTKDKKGEFFDSYGESPEMYTTSFLTFLQTNCEEWVHNKKDLQILNSRYADSIVSTMLSADVEGTLWIL